MIVECENTQMKIELTITAEEAMDSFLFAMVLRFSQ